LKTGESLRIAQQIYYDNSDRYVSHCSKRAKEFRKINNENETNSFNEWQKNFRVGEIDYDLLNFALDVDNIYSKGIDKKLMITCNDQRPDFKFDYTKLNMEFRSFYKSFSPEGKSFKQQNVYLK
jgi:adenylosuccinate synthase